MIEKASILSDKEIHSITDHWNPVPSRLDGVTPEYIKLNLFKAVTTAQLDSCHEYYTGIYEPKLKHLRQQNSKLIDKVSEIKSQVEALEKKLHDREADLENAKREEREKIKQELGKELEKLYQQYDDAGEPTEEESRALTKIYILGETRWKMFWLDYCKEEGTDAKGS